MIQHHDHEGSAYSPRNKNLDQENNRLEVVEQLFAKQPQDSPGKEKS